MALSSGGLDECLGAQGQSFGNNPCTASGAAGYAFGNGAQKHPSAARLVSKGPYSRVVQSHTSGNSSALCQRTPQSHTRLGGIPFESDILLIQYHSISSNGKSAFQPRSPIFDQEPEIRGLKEIHGKKPRFNDAQRRRLAAKAKKIRYGKLKEIAIIATPQTSSPLVSHPRGEET